MRNVKNWMFAALAAAMLTGTIELIRTQSATAEANERLADRDHWRYHDGHWAYWHDADKRWYYTDGGHWYYHEGNAWRPYRFDRQFGREGFERGEYRVVPEDAKVVVPRHDVYVPKDR